MSASISPAAGAASADSPLIAQYLTLKQQYPEALLLSRVGDFYEAYAGDAEELASALHIVLTSKEAGKGKRVAMAGVPHHSVDTYLARLIRQRRVIAIADQMEQPVPNRLVRREIVRVLTPGTVLEDQFLQPDRHNYLCAVTIDGAAIALAAADVSTGDAFVRAAVDMDELAAAIDELGPAEIVVADEAQLGALRPIAPSECRLSVAATAVAGNTYAQSAAFSRDERPAVDGALRLLEGYLTRLKLDGSALAQRARAAAGSATMLIDPATRRHLDLLSASSGDARASLYSVLARTRTPMGSRLLARRICAPLLDAQAIRRRLDAVEALVRRASSRVALQEVLAGIGDVERIVRKVRARRANPRDLAALRRSLQHIEALGQAAARGREGSDGAAHELHVDAASAAIARLLEAAIVDDPPPVLADGGAIRPSHVAELADAIDLRTNSRERLLALEQQTKARTGIKSLRIKFTQAFGYYFEVPRAHADGVPADFSRRQSLVNAERFYNVELKELENAMLTAKARQVALERDAFESVAIAIDQSADALLALSSAVAALDVSCALAQVAAERRYVRPELVEESTIDVEAGRHPIVEACATDGFVANDCAADADRRFLLITGPNMGGKSTYLRQAALLSVLAQMGSFVPATRARLGIVDRLFTRIGAGDDIAAGRSTFYVEMAETSLILRRCTPRSLLLIDEVGRGTGTTDGLAIAQAISEYLIGLGEAMPIVLFATHFHELVRLSGTFPVVQNLHAVVADERTGPVFSHRVLQGASSRSYGIAVAEMAGLPPEVVARAREIADEIESRPQLQSRSLRRRREPGGSDDQLRLTI